ncbi:MAG: cytochrome c oxidase subunit 3 [Acidobacteria bacterium]|nr:cytochrome c oxidase subunit 3 [Acidobacteriota bacterium]
MDNVIAFDTARVGRADDEIDRHEDVVRLGLWIFLATVTMLFAAFTSAYIVRRSGTDWRPIALPSVLWLNTLVLAASSLALEVARWSGTGSRWRAASVAFAAAIALGFAFLGGQVLAWRQLMAVGLYAPASPHSSFFYMLTAVHGLHVIAALAVLAWGAVRTWTGAGRRDLRQWTGLVGICRTFWHFLGGVWIYLFVLLSIY